MAEQFGPYRLDHLIGRGGMGEVHRAYDTVRGRTVALKRLPSTLADDPEFQARFRRESALAAQLSEPHIIPIHDFGEIDGRLYIDMRLVEGTDLASVVARHGPMPARRAVSILAQVASALDAAHAAGLVHRDVKPSNVIVRGADDAEDEFAYLIDFGIARSTTSATAAPSLTAVGATVGTLDYMAPERFGGGPVDARTDVYSLACVLFELLTGRPPFTGLSALGLMHAHVTSEVPRPSAHRGGLPPGLDAVVAQGMAKDPGRRPPTAGALVAAARSALRQTPPPAPGPTAPSPLPQLPVPTRPAPLAAPPAPPFAGAPRYAAPAPAAFTPPPAGAPARPAGMVVALVVQLLSGALVLVGGVAAFVAVLVERDTSTTADLFAGVAVGGLLLIVPGFYLVAAAFAFAGRGWARWSVAGMHGLLAVATVGGLVTGGTTAGGATGAVLVVAIVLGSVAPLFTAPARAFYQATALRRAAR